RASAPHSKSRGEHLLSLGGRLQRLHLHEAVTECVRLLAAEPQSPLTQHAIAALRGDNPEHLSAHYVRQLFDAYAPDFDQSLIGKLAYSAPRELADSVLALHERPRPWHMLDLGCGTRLVAAKLAPHTAHIVGIDLSPKMIERARQRNLYARLVCED